MIDAAFPNGGAPNETMIARSNATESVDRNRARLTGLLQQPGTFEIQKAVAVEYDARANVQKTKENQYRLALERIAANDDFDSNNRDTLGDALDRCVEIALEALK
jgi:hypothetical protein